MSEMDVHLIQDIVVAVCVAMAFLRACQIIGTVVYLFLRRWFQL